MHRRDFVKSIVLAGAAGPQMLSAHAGARPTTSSSDSGAGGGTVAARLAEAGYSVLVLEAGGDPRTGECRSVRRARLSSLRHRERPDAVGFLRPPLREPAAAGARPQVLPAQNGVWYPRAGTLGGCTAHNAMILAYPSHADWDQIADLTGDPSWRSPAMWKYFERVRRSGFVDSGENSASTSRTAGGWLSTERPRLTKPSPTASARRHRLGRQRRPKEPADRRWPGSKRCSIPTIGASSTARKPARAIRR